MTLADHLFKRHRFDRLVMVLCVRWYLSYKLSYRDLPVTIDVQACLVPASPGWESILD